MPSLLHAGCGRSPKPDWADAYTEVRLDIDPGVQPDIVASLTDLGDIGPYDAAYLSHCLEHFYPHEVPKVLAELRRVLKPGGFVVIVVPDLEDIRPTDDVVYVSPGGPICGLDMIYGGGGLIQASPYMAHHCGFVRDTLQRVLDASEFSKAVVERIDGFNLLAAAVR